MKHFYKENNFKSLAVTFLFLLAVVWQQTALAAPRNVTVKPEPTWIKKLPQRTQTKISPDDVNGGYHYLLMNMQIEVAKQETYYRNVYKLTTEEGVQNYSEIRLSFDPNHEQLQLHKIVVWRNGKPINKLDLNKVKVIQREQGMDRGIYDESLTAVLVLEDIRVGDILEYACTIKGGNPVFRGKFFNSFNLQNYDPMDELLVRIEVPQNRKLNYKLYRTNKEPKVAKEEGNTTYTWHLQNLPGTVVDDETPSWFDPYPGVYMSEFNTWQEVAQWALPLYQGFDKPAKALQAKIDSIKSTVGSDEQRLEAALRFVQDEVRYLGYEAGIGGFKPRAPSEVFNSRFGDCKDKALLLCTMLRQMDITAYPALVNSSTQAHVQDVLPSPSAFNHCIVQVELLGGKTYWYDATISKQRGDFKNIYLPEYGKALVIAPATKKLTTVVSPTSDRPHVQSHEIYYIDAIDKAVTLEVRTEYTGSEADYQRSYFSTTSMNDIDKGYLNFYANQYPEIEKAQNIRTEDQEINNTFIVIEKYTIPNFWIAQDDNEKVVEAWFSPLLLRSYIRQPQTIKRTMPLALSHPLYVEQKITVLLPESWPIADEEKEVEDNAFYFRKTVAYGPAGKELTLHYSYQSRQDHVTAAATAGYLRKQKDLLDELGYGITYNKAFISGGEKEFSWGMLLVVVLLFAGFSAGAYKLYFWDPLPAQGYQLLNGERISGWLVLPLIGLIFTPIRVLNFLSTNEYFNQQVWAELLNTSSNVYSPALVSVSLGELTANVAFLVFSLLFIYLFIKRRTSVPKLMMIYYGVNLCYVLLDNLLVHMLDLPGVATDESVRNIISALAGAGIWIPYFKTSTKVKATFVVQLNPDPTEDDAQQVEEEVMEHTLVTGE
ncbi:DUF3857 domain-containing protein [Pontibacter sp. MBLB2868]|uniref:DUF3857 domain-containing protein n=1 Tax=Pontibacter sp. MBLB2868 TaxID=3451555 RepID=UPI003F74E61B